MSEWYQGLQSVEVNIAALAQSFEPEQWVGKNAAEVVRTAESIIRSAMAIQTLAAHRVEQTNGYDIENHPDAASWVATQKGVSKAEASKMLATGRRAADLPELRDAALEGRVSPAQLDVVARAGEADPSSLGEMLRSVESESVNRTAERSRRIVAEKSAEAERRHREYQRKQRRSTYRARDDGCVDIHTTLLPEEGAEYITRHKAERKRIFRAAQKSGRWDSYNQYDADAFMAIIRSTGEKKPTKAEVLVLVDAGALQRGYRESGERCYVPGVGNLSVDAVNELFGGDASVRFILEQAKDIRSVTSSTRYIPKSVQVALKARGLICSNPWCQEPAMLQIDHIDDYAKTKNSGYDNLQSLCANCHAKKTYGKWPTPKKAPTDRKEPPGDPPNLFNSA